MQVSLEYLAMERRKVHGVPMSTKKGTFTNCAGHIIRTASESVQLEFCLTNDGFRPQFMMMELVSGPVTLVSVLLKVSSVSYRTSQNVKVPDARRVCGSFKSCVGG